MSTSGKNVILWTAYINFLFLGNQEHLNICIFIYVYIYIFVYLYICICVYLYILRNYVRVEVEQRRAECRETLLAQLVAMRPSSFWGSYGKVQLDQNAIDRSASISKDNFLTNTAKPQILKTAPEIDVLPQILKTAWEIDVLPQILKTASEINVAPQILKTASEIDVAPQILKTASEIDVAPQLLRRTLRKNEKSMSMMQRCKDTKIPRYKEPSWVMQRCKLP